MQEYTERLGDAPLGRLLIKLSLPGIAASVSTSLYNLVNTIWITRVGYQAIAALTIVFPYQIIFYAIGNGTGTGIAALVSRRFGERNPDAANHVAGQIFYLSTFWGVIFILISNLLSDSLLTLLGSTPDIMVYGRQYLVVASFGAPFVIFSLVTANLIRGSGDAVKPMVMMLSSTLINIVLDPLLIFGIGPFPEMGVAGAALGTVIAQAFGALLGLYYFLAGKTAYRIKPAHLRPDMTILRDIYRIGAPSAITMVIESFAFILFNNVLSSFGSLMIAVAGIAMRVLDIAFMPAMGASGGLLPIVGYNYGALNYRRLWRAVKLASVGIMIVLAILTIFLMIFAQQIIDFFTDDPALLAEGVPAMRIMLSSMLLIGPTMMFITAFQGLSQGTKSLVLSLLRQFLIFIPVLFLFRHLFGLLGVWVSIPTSDLLSFALISAFTYREYQKHRHNDFYIPT
jgi:putative MATE family efflux protein